MADESGHGRLEEVVVTALKRETQLGKTPLAISVISGDELDATGSREFMDYFRRVPGMATVESGAGRKRYVIRGVNSLGSGQAQATVAQYIDEVPITSNFDQQPDPRLVDVERVEVLRGPQGTLFGARSMSGTIRTITRKPTMDRFRANAAVTLSHTRFGGLNKDVEGTINIPLSSQVALRVNGFYAHEEGYVDNVFAGGTFIANRAQLPPGFPPTPPITLAPATEKNFSDVTSYGGRMSVRFVANDRLTIDLMGLAQKTEVAGVPFYDAFLTGDEANGLITAVVGDSGNDDTLLVGSGTATYAFDWAQWTVAMSYTKRDNFVLSAAVPVGPLFQNGPGSTNSFGGNTKSFTAETRLVSTTQGRWQWLVGGYAFHQDRDSRLRDYFAFGNVAISDYSSTQNTDERAVFGELSYEPLTRFKITAGVRYTDYDTRLDRFFITPPPGGFFAPGQDPNPPGHKGDDITLKFQASYQATDDLMIYALAAEGFRPGGFNAGTQPGYNTVPQTFESDSLWSYELGTKSAWFGRRLRAEGAFYLIDWSNIQTETTVRPPAGPGMLQYLTNVPTARIAGVELSLTAELDRHWTLSGSLNQFFDCNLTKDAPIQPGGITPRKGDRLPTTADTTFNINADYRAPVSERLDLFARVEWYYTGVRQVGFRPTLDSGAPHIGYSRFAPYHLMNLRVGIASGPWTASVFVNNVTDNRAVMRQSNFAPIAAISRISIKPRTVGINLRTQY